MNLARRFFDWRRIRRLRRATVDWEGWVVREVAGVLEATGCCHGHESSHSTPPTMYPEWIACAVRHAAGNHRSHCADVVKGGHA